MDKRVVVPNNSVEFRSARIIYSVRPFATDRRKVKGCWGRSSAFGDLH